MKNENFELREDLIPIVHKAKVALSFIFPAIVLIYFWEYLIIACKCLWHCLTEAYFWYQEFAEKTQEICKTPLSSLTIADLLCLAFPCYLAYLLYLFVVEAYQNRSEDYDY